MPTVSTPLYQDYFDLQLRFAGRYAELAGMPLTEAITRCTNLRRRFRLLGSEGETRWADFLERVQCCPSHGDVLVVAMALHEAAPRPTPSPFGCFTYDPPGPEGVLRLHFMPEERHRYASPLRHGVSERHAELRALLMEVRRLHPGVREVRGLSWLYHLDAYRALFPARYVASVKPVTEGLNMTGSSTWGQVLDHRHRLRSGISDRILARMTPAIVGAPWKAFPLQPMSAVGPVADFFERFVQDQDRDLDGCSRPAAVGCLPST